MGSLVRIRVKGIMKQKVIFAHRALFTKNIFKRVKNMGCPRLNFLLPAVIDSGESIYIYIF
jgi:hypothetical protein